jgi:hypothetical protein
MSKELIESLEKKLREVTAERDETDALFDLQWKADQRAIKLWQKAHPGKENIWPDRCDMVVWLMDQLDKLQSKNQMATIDKFDGDFGFLSNFWPSKVTLDGVEFDNVEAAFQAAKTHDLTEREKIRSASTPGKAKKLGRKVSLREDWNDIRISVMRDLLQQKFNNKELRKLLIDTGSAALVEGNTWNDKFWGVCDGEGENNLGKLLMDIRNALL